MVNFWKEVTLEVERRDIVADTVLDSLQQTWQIWIHLWHIDLIRITYGNVTKLLSNSVTICIYDNCNSFVIIIETKFYV